jgi:hypothetical protein
MLGIAAEAWTALTSLVGVAIGGGLSYAIQLGTKRAAAQSEERKQQRVTLENRRTARLAQLERFVEVAAVEAQAVMERFWIAERMIRVCLHSRYTTQRGPRSPYPSSFRETPLAISST